MEHESTDTEATYTIDVIPDSEIALFHWVGPITLEDRLNNLEIMAAFCAENSVRKMIIDGRDQQSETDTIESWQFGSAVPEAFRGLCVAVVHRPDDKSLALIETVAFNRGSTTRSFTDFDEARNWLDLLGGPPASE